MQAISSVKERVLKHDLDRVQDQQDGVIAILKKAHATYLFLAVQQDLDDLLRLGVHFEDGFQDTEQVQLGFHETLVINLHATGTARRPLVDSREVSSVVRGTSTNVDHQDRDLRAPHDTRKGSATSSGTHTNTHTDSLVGGDDQRTHVFSGCNEERK